MKRPSWILFVLLAAYILGAAYWLPRVRAQMNPDGISYISLAERYLAGDFAGALNGHWGPIFSWLLTPLLALRIEPLLASKVQTFATGFATLFGAWLWSSRYTQIVAVRGAVCAALAPLLLAWAATAVSPDLLIVCFLTYYAYFISDPAPSRRSTSLAAIFGALTYFAKSYGFVFFLIHFTLVCAGRWFCEEQGRRRREIIHRFGLGLAVFLVFSLPWATALSVKYGRPTFGTAGAYNFGLVGPANGPVGSQGHPMHLQGLLSPPDEHAVSAWDDPTYMRFPPWPSFAPSAQRISANVIENIFVLCAVLNAASRLVWPILTAALIIPFWRGGPTSRLVLATLASGALYTAGYLPLLVEARYIWILSLLLLMIAAGLVDLVAQRFSLHTITALLIAAAIAASFIASPLASVPMPGEIERESAEIAQSLAADGIDLRQRSLASDDHWAKTLYLAYFVRARYFGTILRGNPAEVRRQLDLHRIDTFLVWAEQPAPPAYLDGFRAVPISTAGGRFALYERAVAKP